MYRLCGMWPAVALALVSFVVSLALAPAVVNGDGLGYLNASVTSALAPGHLAYLPLLKVIRAIGHAGPRPVDGLGLARALSAASGALAVLATGGAARRLGGSATVAAAGMASSFAVLAAASDVETYAPALAALSCALWAAAARRDGAGPATTFACALATACAALFHVENALFALPMALALPPRDRAPLVAIVAVLAGGAYALAIHAHGVAWFLGASHGFHYPLTLATPAVALYGACKALVFSPYPYEASWPSVLRHFAAGAAALAALGFLARPLRAPLGRATTWAWALPYSAVGVAFFASDQERWLFLVPLLWLAVSRGSRPRAALAVAALLFAANLAVWLPRARDASWRARAAAAAAHAADGDLVVSPGHGWDEYLGFYEGPVVERFPLVYFAGALGGSDPTSLRRALADAASRARARGGKILLVRFDGGADPMGWKELRLFDVTPANATALLPPGRRVPLGDGVERLDR